MSDTAESNSATHKAPVSLLGLAWPLMISFTFRAVLTSIDIVYGGGILGDAAVAAIGLAAPLDFTFIACWVGVSAALTSHLSRAMGEKNQPRLEQLLSVTRWVVGVLGVAFVGLGAGLYFGVDQLGIEDPEVAASFQVYGPIVVASACVGFLSVIPDSLVKAHHDTKTTMIAGMLSGVTNVVLNTLFVLGFGWGVFGLALGTGLARVGGFVYAWWRAGILERQRLDEWSQEPTPVQTKPAASARWSDEVLPDGRLARPLAALLVLAVPSSLTFTLMALEGGAVNYLLNALPDPKASLAAYALYYRSVMFLLMPIIGTGVAVLPFVARLVGEGRTREVAQGLREGFLFAYGYSFVVVLPVSYLLGPWVAGALSKSEETEALATFALQYASPVAVLVSIPFLMARPAFEAVQRGTPGLIMAALRYLVLSLPLAYLGALFGERYGVGSFAGVLGGLIAGGALASGIFAAWLSRMLAGLVAQQQPAA